MTLPAVWPWRKNLWPLWASVSSSIKWDQWILPQLSWGPKGTFLQSLACRRCSTSFMPVLMLSLVGWLKDHNHKQLHRVTRPDSHPTRYPSDSWKILGWPWAVLYQRFSGTTKEKLIQLPCLENHREKTRRLCQSNPGQLPASDRDHPHCRL